MSSRFLPCRPLTPIICSIASHCHVSSCRTLPAFYPTAVYQLTLPHERSTSNVSRPSSSPPTWHELTGWLPLRPSALVGFTPSLRPHRRPLHTQIHPPTIQHPGPAPKDAGVSRWTASGGSEGEGAISFADGVISVRGVNLLVVLALPSFPIDTF